MKDKKKKRSSTQARIRVANSHLSTLFITLGVCACLATTNILYIMTSHKHIWSGENVLNQAVASSTVIQTLSGTRGSIYDRNHTVLATDSPAYTAILQFDPTFDASTLPADRDITKEEIQKVDGSDKKEEKDNTDTSQSEEKPKEEETKKEENSSTSSDSNSVSSNENEQNKKEEKTSESSSDSDQSSSTTESSSNDSSSEKDPSDLLYCTDPIQTALDIYSVLKDRVDVNSLKNIIRSAMLNERAQTELGNGTKRLDEETMKKLEAKKIPGLSFIPATNRIYPETPFASSLIGYAAYNEDTQNFAGNGGLEAAMESYLAGKDGKRTYQQSRSGGILPGTDHVLEEPHHGYDVNLTIDATLQKEVEKQMQQTMSDNNASKAWCLVMEVETGKVLSWASYPTYNQNTRDDLTDYTDNIAQMTYEPGSVMKPFVYATAIDTNVYPYTGVYRAKEFTYTQDGQGRIIRLNEGSPTKYPVILDALGADYGIITFAEGLAHSSNIAICELLANYVSKDDFNKYLDRFGFFTPTNIDFMLESNGTKNISTADGYLSTGFGQASSLTPLQICQAYTAIFNDGVMMKPYAVDSITDPETRNVIQQNSPEPVGTPISENTARQVTEMLTQVLEPGMSGERFAIEGIDMAAKTGTGEIYDPATGTYSKSEFTSSIVAAAPASDPKIMVYWGMMSTNYVNYSPEPFKNIMKASLRAANINGGTTEAGSEEFKSWSTYSMPSLVNHSLDYATSSLPEKEVNIVVLGDGTSIVDQFPPAGKTVNTGDNIILLTDGNTLTMPNVIGWTRKDLMAFAQLSSTSIIIDSEQGSGKCNWQSIDPNTPIQAGSEIHVKLE